MPTRDEPWPHGTPCWVDLVVPDPEKARAFYTELFGWEVQDSPPEAGGYLMAMRNSRPAAGISGPMEGQAETPAVWTTYLASDSADTTAEAVASAGGRVDVPPFDVMDVGRMLVATDPTGATFGVWQAARHTGAGVYNEHGAYCWNELHTRDYAAAQAFYAAVFGYTYTEIGDGQAFTYSTFTPAGQQEPAGGVSDDTTMPGDAPAHWLTWFQVADPDAAVSTATRLGGSVVMDLRDSPFGRMAVLAGPQGEVFGVIDPATTG
jgi:predicted enzyme related to lactoylglutathione lyase